MRGVRPWKSIVFRVALAAAEGMLAVLTGGFLLAVLILKLGLPSAGVLRFAAGVIWAAGAFLAGRRSARHGRRHGAAEGALCGFVLVLLWLCGAALFGETPDSFLLRIIVLPLSGAAGGILGVNTRLRKPPD